MEYFTIKEASKKLGLESHVLRYWEEELGLSIKRNEMGHRYYDSRNMEMFGEIQKLKEQGFSLKDIRCAIEKYKQGYNEEKNEKERMARIGDQHVQSVQTDLVNVGDEDVGSKNDLPPQVVEFKTAQLQSIMNRVVANALRENTEMIVDSVKSDVVKEVIHQVDLIMRENEDREMEHYRKIDETLRKLQQANEEVAATRMSKRRWRKKQS